MKKPSHFPLLRIILMVLGVVALVTSLGNEWFPGVIGAAVFVLLAAIAK